MLLAAFVGRLPDNRRKLAGITRDYSPQTGLDREKRSAYSPRLNHSRACVRARQGGRSRFAPLLNLSQVQPQQSPIQSIGLPRSMPFQRRPRQADGRGGGHNSKSTAAIAMGTHVPWQQTPRIVQSLPEKNGVLSPPGTRPFRGLFLRAARAAGTTIRCAGAQTYVSVHR
jgi:hypothetical protein